MATTDYKFPGTAANVPIGSNNDWETPNNAKTDDGVYAKASGAKADSDYLRLTNFGFTSADIPVGATITGIEVVVKRYADYANDINDLYVYLIDSDSIHAGDNKASAIYWPLTTPSAETYGGAGDTWNANLDQADIVSANFGVDIAFNNGAQVADYGYIDYVKIKIIYTMGGLANFHIIAKLQGNGVNANGYLDQIKMRVTYYYPTTLGKSLMDGLTMVTEFSRATGRTLVQIISVVPRLTRAIGRIFATAIVTLIPSSGQAKINIGHTYSQNIVVAPTYGALKVLTRSLTQAVVVVGSKVITTAKRITNNVVIVGTKLAATGRVLKQNIVVVGAISFAKSKILTQNVAVAASKIFSTARTLTQAVKVAPVLNVIRAQVRLFTQNIVTTAALGSMAIGKLLKQTVSIIITFSTPNVPHKFVENVKVASSVVKQVGRTFKQNVVAIASFLKRGGKLLSANVRIVAPAITYLPGKFFPESFRLVAQVKTTLNGTIVGLWTKVAKITGSWTKGARISGLWQKKSRNDSL